jgi:hypothetical protein
METTKNEMPPYAKQFFNKLRNYLDTPLYFYGSIQRDDYFPKSSDIDVDIYSDNINSVAIKLQTFLNNILGDNSIEFKNFVKLININQLVKGYKISYVEPENNFTTEFSIYDEKNKETILTTRHKQIFLPFYATWLLIIIKFFYYTLNILPKEWYRYFKDVILHKLIYVNDEDFVVL